MGSTARLALPYPEDTDPLANMAAAVQALATAVDGLLAAKTRRGQTTATTDASGDQTITHGLGVTPTSVLVTQCNNGSNVILAPHTYTSTTFKVRNRASTTAAAVSGASLTTAWAVSA